MGKSKGSTPAASESASQRAKRAVDEVVVAERMASAAEKRKAATATVQQQRAELEAQLAALNARNEEEDSDDDGAPRQPSPVPQQPARPAATNTTKTPTPTQQGGNTATPAAAHNGNTNTTNTSTTNTTNTSTTNMTNNNTTNTNTNTTNTNTNTTNTSTTNATNTNTTNTNTNTSTTTGSAAASSQPPAAANNAAPQNTATTTTAQSQPQLRGAWANGAPQMAPATVEKINVPDAVAAAVAAHLGCQAVSTWATVPRLPKKVAEMVGTDCWCTKLKHEYADLFSAEKFEENFRRQAMARAASLLMVVFPGVGSWLFLWGVAAERRMSAISTRGTVITTASAELPVPTGFLKHFQEATVDTYVLQGPRAVLEKWAGCLVFRARVGKEEGQAGTEWVEALGVPKPGWQQHLCGMPAAAVKNARPLQDRGATVQLPFGEFGVQGRFAVAGSLAALVGGQALVCGFDVRVVSPTPWTEDLRKKVLAHTFGGKKAVAKVFTDVPPAGSRDLGGTPSKDSVVVAASAVEAAAPLDRGLVVVAARGCDEAVWKEAVALLGADARLLKFNLAMAAVAVPAPRAAALIDRSLGGVFWLRSPAALLAG